jgi:hypothetical protein
MGLKQMYVSSKCLKCGCHVGQNKRDSLVLFGDQESFQKCELPAHPHVLSDYMLVKCARTRPSRSPMY